MTYQSPRDQRRDQRRFPRYAVQIPVLVHRRGSDVTITTADVSRHGAFLHTTERLPLRQLVQLRFRCPGVGDVEAMCMVARLVGAEHPRGPGAGVDLFALSKDAKKAWEHFIAELRAHDTFHDATIATVPGSAPPLPVSGQGAKGHPDWLINRPILAEALPRTSTPFARVSALSVGTEAAPAPPPAAIAPSVDEHGRATTHGSVVMMRFPDVSTLRYFLTTDLERGGTFLHTPLVKDVGQKIDVVMLHPETDDEFHLEGTVIRRVISGPDDTRGLGIFFKALTTATREQLEDFAAGGIEVVDLANVVTDRQLELELAVAREPDSAEALEALGSYLLDEANDLGGALTALTRALLLGPSVVSIHASLARAYRKIGDTVRVRAHERVAEALLHMQDRLRVSFGVGEPPPAE
ncbi:MAG: PilZ domain-containing protein [Deltaproteobacteria bacterium]|nr:PilZ domain-containing protein [Deltaproteobacteria bacterium]